MPPDDQATRSAARCDSHPGTASVAVCESCGRALCLACAVPVRGRVIGRECLAEVLGPEGSPAPAPVPPRPRNPLLRLATVAFAVAAAASVLPWTHFGVGSGMFGGWEYDPPRWSLVEAAASAVGLTLSAFLVARTVRHGWIAKAALPGLALAGVLGTVLHILNPPPFTQAWYGSWVALGGAAVASFATLSLLVRRRAGDLHSLTHP
ncbi:MAG: hypothetical protein ABR600_13925 [Actinomycetota bacterium]